MLLHEPRHGERQPAGHQRRAAVAHVAAVLDGADRRRVGGGATDPLLLHGLDEGGLGVARWWRRLVAERLGAHDPQQRALAQPWQPALLRGLVLAARGLALVTALLVGGEEAAERDDGAAGGELDRSCRRTVVEGRAEAHGCRRATGVGHLRGDGALPDELVEGVVLPAQLPCHLGRGPKAVTGGTDGLVCLLGVLHLALVVARRIGDVVRPVEIPGLLAGGGERGIRQGGAVGAHVGDVAVLVEALGDPHRVAAVEPQLPGGLLLEGARRERRTRAPRVRLLRDVGDPDVGSAQGVRDAGRGHLVERRRLGVRQRAVVGEVTAGRDLAAVHTGEARGEEVRLGVRRELGVDVPVARRAEGHPLALTLDDEPRRDGLDPPGGQPGLDLAPQHRAHLVAVEAVEDAPGLLGVDEARVDLARGVRRALDGLLGDLVEDHPLHGDRRLERLQQVPGDGLALAVLIRGEVELVGVLEQGLQLADLLLLVGVDDVERVEVVLDVHPELAERALLDLRRHLARRGDVTDVPHRRLDVPVAAEIAGDGPRLGGRLDDDELAS